MSLGNGDSNNTVLYTLRRVKRVGSAKALRTVPGTMNAHSRFFFVFVSNEHSLSDYLDKTFVELDRCKAI